MWGPDRFDETRGGSKMLAFDVFFQQFQLHCIRKSKVNKFMKKKDLQLNKCSAQFVICCRNKNKEINSIRIRFTMLRFQYRL